MKTTIKRNEAVTEDLINEYFQQEYSNISNMYIRKTSDYVITVFDANDVRIDELRIIQ